MHRAQPTVRSFAAIAVLGLGLSGCLHVQRGARAPVAAAGASSFAFIESPPPSQSAGAVATAEDAGPAEVLLVAKPIEPLAKPVYPAAALGVERTAVVVSVKIAIDAEGRVAQVGTNPLRWSTPTRFQGEFLRAIEEAVAQWRFRPAVLRRLVQVKEAGREPHWVVTRADRTDYLCEVAFTFTATGDVLSALP